MLTHLEMPSRTFVASVSIYLPFVSQVKIADLVATIRGEVQPQGKSATLDRPLFPRYCLSAPKLHLGLALPRSFSIAVKHINCLDDVSLERGKG